MTPGFSKHPSNERERHTCKCGARGTAEGGREGKKEEKDKELRCVEALWVTGAVRPCASHSWAALSLACGAVHTTWRQGTAPTPHGGRRAGTKDERSWGCAARPSVGGDAVGMPGSAVNAGAFWLSRLSLLILCRCEMHRSDCCKLPQCVENALRKPAVSYLQPPAGPLGNCDISLLTPLFSNLQVAMWRCQVKVTRV